MAGNRCPAGHGNGLPGGGVPLHGGSQPGIDVGGTLGHPANFQGTACRNELDAAVFLAQVYGIDMSAGAMALVVAMAVGASIGSPATPGVGIVILAMVLSTVGIPVEGVALLMGVDRILDMMRTATNVWSDLVGTAVISRFEGRSS